MHPTWRPSEILTSVKLAAVLVENVYDRILTCLIESTQYPDKNRKKYFDIDFSFLLGFKMV